MGSIAYGRAEYENAIRLYQQALDLKSDVVDAYWGIAISYRAVGQQNLAIHAFSEFLRLAPSSYLASAAQWYITELQTNPS
jgi:tetratricopeptide (TPR) repeat protein